MPLQFNLSVPTNLIAEMTVEYVQLPSEEGSMGVLQGHASLRCALEPGVITCRTLDKKNHYFCVSTGLAMIQDDVVTVLADSAEKAENIDEERAKNAAERARERMHAQSAGIDRARAEASLARSLARVKAKQKTEATH